MLNTNHLRRLALILLAISGVLLVVVGFIVQGEPYGAILTAIGGSVIGAIISGFVTGIESMGFISSTQVLTEALDPGISSDEGSVAAYRCRWHMYHVTRAEGKIIWRHSRLDLTEYTPLGRLKGALREKKLDNEARRLVGVEAGLRGERFFLVLEPPDQEPPAIVIFPFMGKRFRKTEAGISIHESWSQEHMLAPCLITTERLTKTRRLGTIDSEEDVSLLNEEWKTQWEGMFDRNPRPNHFLLPHDGETAEPE